MMFLKNNRSKIVFMIFLFLVCIGIAGMSYIKYVLPESMERATIFHNWIWGEKVNVEDLGEDFRQEIILEEGSIVEEISIQVGCRQETPGSSVVFTLNQGQKIIQSWEHFFDDDSVHEFHMTLEQPIVVDAAELYLSVQKGEQYVEESGYLWKGYWNVPQTISYNGDSQNEFDITMLIQGGTCYYVKVLFVFVCILFLCMYLVVCYMMLTGKYSLESLFVVVGLFVGVVYIFAWSPYACPDEYSHITTTYYYSNSIMDQPILDEEGNVYVRSEDLTMTPSEHLTRKYSYYVLTHDSFFEDSIDQNVITIKREPLKTSAMSYFPQIIATIVAQMLGLGNVAWLILGRFFALIFFLVCGYFAIKTIPFAKMPLMVLMLGPTSIQGAASFSYDCVLNATSFLFVSYVLYLAYKKTKVQLKDWLLLMACCLLFVPIKVVYVFLVLCVCLIPNSKIHQQRLYSLGMKVCLFLVSIVPIVVSKLSVINTMTSSGGKEAVEGYSLAHILSNPAHTVFMWLNTIKECGGGYIKQVFGGFELYSEISVIWIAVLGFYVLLILALCAKEDDVIMDKKGKLLSVGVCAGVLAAIFLVFNLDLGTRLYSNFVNGIQGRYFLPILPLVFCVAQNKNIIVKKSIDDYLILGVYGLQFLTVLNIFLTVVAR